MFAKVVAGVVVAGLVGAALLGAGFWIGRTTAPATTAQGWFGSMMQGYGMMGGPGMMGGAQGSFGLSLAGSPLAVEEVAAAVETYLSRLGNSNLAIDEIMVFDNNAYVSIVDQQTKSGAFEVLVDPGTKAVFLEYGPAMMWNTDYGMMGGRGFGMMGSGGMMGGGMMGPGGSVGGPGAQPGQASVTAEQALQIAQDYLDQYQPGVKVADHANAFPGYYTIDTEKDGSTLGMLSVNAYTSQVWVHTWHGKFVEEREMME